MTDREKNEDREMDEEVKHRVEQAQAKWTEERSAKVKRMLQEREEEMISKWTPVECEN